MLPASTARLQDLHRGLPRLNVRRKAPLDAAQRLRAWDHAGTLRDERPDQFAYVDVLARDTRCQAVDRAEAQVDQLLANGRLTHYGVPDGL